MSDYTAVAVLCYLHCSGIKFSTVDDMFNCALQYREKQTSVCIDF